MFENITKSVSDCVVQEMIVPTESTCIGLWGYSGLIILFWLVYFLLKLLYDILGVLASRKRCE